MNYFFVAAEVGDRSSAWAVQPENRVEVTGNAVDGVLKLRGAQAQLRAS